MSSGLLLLSLLTLVSLAAPQAIPTIDFAKSHYDFEHCGKTAAGRARRSQMLGEDYVDGLDFGVEDEGDAGVGELPWAVAIETRVPGGRAARLCAGTLVSRRHVLSAAHCLAKADAIPFTPGHIRCEPTDHFDLNDFIDWSTVKYGGECLNGVGSACADPSLHAKSIGIRNISLFNFFQDDCSRGSDLMIVELEEDVDVPHACLSHLHDLEDVSLMSNKTLATFHTFAWATDKSKGIEKANRLQKSSLTLKSDRCARQQKFLSSDVLCAAPGKHIEQCLGESGAGLLLSSSGRSFLLGVLSSSTACAPPGPQKEQPESRFTDVRLFSASIDRALGTGGPMPDLSDLV